MQRAGSYSLFRIIPFTCVGFYNVPLIITRLKFIHTIKRRRFLRWWRILVKLVIFTQVYLNQILTVWKDKVWLFLFRSCIWIRTLKRALTLKHSLCCLAKTRITHYFLPKNWLSSFICRIGVPLLFTHRFSCNVRVTGIMAAAATIAMTMTLKAILAFFTTVFWLVLIRRKLREVLRKQSVTNVFPFCCHGWNLFLQLWFIRIGRRSLILLPGILYCLIIHEIYEFLFLCSCRFLLWHRRRYLWW